MFDVYLGDIELTTLTLILSLVVVLPVQLLLCFKVKSILLRLLPAVIFSFLTAALMLAGYLIQGWDGLGLIFLAIFAGIMTLACGIAWIVFAIVRCARRKR